MSLSRALNTEIASQRSGFDALIESPFDSGADGLGFEVDDLAAVTEMFFHEVWAIVNIAAQFQSVGCDFSEKVDLFSNDPGFLGFYGVEE